MTIGTSEIRSRITAIAEPKPTRLASLMLLLVIRMDSSSRPFLPWLMMNAMSNARSASIAVITTTTTLIGALQPGQVDDHDVADMTPRGGDQDRVEVDARVAKPVEDMA